VTELGAAQEDTILVSPLVGGFGGLKRATRAIRRQYQILKGAGQRISQEISFRKSTYTTARVAIPMMTEMI
jgi:hypothetical protein